jgi:glycerophosphoryl diester phosphodiesterase
MLHPYFRSHAPDASGGSAAFDAAGPMILGHRGAAGRAPENTLLSFRRCLELGAHAVESDVQVTADGVPVLLHDATLGRVGDRDVAVSSLTFDALASCDAAWHWSLEDRGATEPPDAAAFRGQGHRVPSVEEAFDALPDARFNLEIKTTEGDAVARVVRLVAERDRADRTLLVAGDDAIMRSLRDEIARQGVEVATSASLSEVVAVVKSAVDGSAPPAEIQALQVPARFGDSPLITRALVEHAHRHDVMVHVWTINDPEEMERLLDLGVDGLVTDFPDRAAAVVAARAARG